MKVTLPEELARRYTAGEELGRGGMGVVLRAVQRGLDRPVAIKILAGDDLTADDRARFQQEGRAAARLSHANLVQVIEAGLDGATLYIVYELVEGGSLRGLLKYERVLAPARALAFVAQIADGVGAAHRAGLVHRDLKPENVLLGDGERAKVTDFGIAKLTDGSGVKTKTGIVLGTPGYIAPELVREEPISPAADVYALGVMLYEMLTGELPYQGKPVDVLIAHVEKPVPPLPGRVPAGLRTLVGRMLAKQPGDRPETMAEVAELARTLAADESRDVRPGPRPTGRTPVREQATAMVSRPPLDATHATQVVARPRAPVPTIVIALLTFAAGVGVTIALQRKPPEAVRYTPTASPAAPSPVAFATLPPPPPAPATARPARPRRKNPGLGRIMDQIEALGSLPQQPVPAAPPPGPAQPFPPLTPGALPPRPPDLPPVPGAPYHPPAIPTLAGRRPRFPSELTESAPWPLTDAEKRLAAADPDVARALTSPTRKLLAAKAAGLRSQGKVTAAMVLVDRLVMWAMADAARYGPGDEVKTGDDWLDRLAGAGPELLHGDPAAAYRELYQTQLAYDPPSEGHAPRFLAYVALLLQVQSRADARGAAVLAQEGVTRFLRARDPRDPWFYAAALIASELTYRLGGDRAPEVDEVVSREPVGLHEPSAHAFQPVHKRLQAHLDALEKKD